MSSRRTFLRILGASVLSGHAAFSDSFHTEVRDDPDDLVTEQQQGDPDAPIEYVTFSPSRIGRANVNSGKATFEKWGPTVPISMISVARGFIGFTRTANPEQIAKFLALFDLPLRSDRGDVAFCAAGLSYCALAAYSNSLSGASTETFRVERLKRAMPDVEHYYFYPTVSCVDMYHIAAGKRHWIDRKLQPHVLPSPGWIVLYDWNHTGIADHCGLVQSASERGLVTVEFNTATGEGNQRTGGVIAEKSRTYDQVLGFVKTDTKY
jgi:hypothetical protein